MGKISEWQRQQLDSSAVGTPGLDQSGEMIAKTIGATTDAMIKRQQVLEDVEVTNAFYSFQTQDEVQRLKLQNQFKSQPEAFEQAYMQQHSQLSRDFRDKLPERTRARFDTLVGRRNASVVPQNVEWTFKAQNEKTLDLSNMTANEFIIQSGTRQDSKGFLEGVGQFREAFKSYAPALLNPDKAEAKYLQEATKSYLYSRLDNNTGNPILLRRELETDEALKAHIVESLGVGGYNKFMNDAEKQVGLLMSEQTYDMTNTALNDPKIAEKYTQLLTDPRGIPVADAYRDVAMKTNALEAVLRDKDARELAESSGQIEVLREDLRQAELIKEISISRNNYAIKNDEGVVADLTNKVLTAALGVSTPSELEKLKEEMPVGVTPESGRSVADMGRDALGMVVNPLNPFAAAGAAGRLSRDVLTSPMTVWKNLRGGGGGVADKPHSEILTRLLKVQGEVLDARNKGKINDKAAHTILNKILRPLATLSEYDSIQAGDSPYVYAMQHYDEIARNSVKRMGGGTPAEREQAVDRARTRMMFQFVEQLAEINDPLAELTDSQLQLKGNGARALVQKVADDFLLAANAGRKEGDVVIMPNGTVARYVSFDRTSGEAVLETPDGLDASLAN